MKNNKKRILIIFGKYREPSPVGTGGNHRAYQIFHDIKSICSNAEIITLSQEEIQKTTNTTNTANTTRKGYTWKDYLSEFIERLKFTFRFARLGGSPYRLLEHIFQSYYNHNHYFKIDDEAYTSILKKHSPIDLCIIDHTLLFEIQRLNAKLEIPTWIFPQNIETFDRYALANFRNKETIPFMVSFQQEIQTMMSYKNRFVISNTEAWVWNGLDIPVHYYPYLPVGEIRDSKLKIREIRGKGNIDPGLFLMVGTSTHKTTEQSFEWFFNLILQNSLPKDCRVIVVGNKTENYREKYKEHLGLDFRGWVEEKVLEDLMCTARAVLIPQLTGFGAVTRITEMACAGIPVLVSNHAVQSFDVPPDVISLPNQWEAWFDAMKSIKENDKKILPDLESYLTWEKLQANPLERLLHRYA